MNEKPWHQAIDKQICERFKFRALRPDEIEEPSFRDEFFTDASTHDPEGRNVMLQGLTLPC